ncbi:RNA 3'-terminal phosphate cyclase [Oceaniferula spumae]|uniref:RNA 3'-terminal phosphate cyclase n=1 Tax=Oceaniferula spumae TaxID=2979115 RepID=A0AAT9FHP4_9BACT
MITLNGQNGGGQILRTALSLSMVTGEAFKISNIRGLRKKPGLMRQHLTCVQAAAEISNGATDGAEIGSTELIFKPDAVQAGDYHFKIGTAGSTTLLAQTLIPALLHADSTSNIVLEGGTHNPLAPSACFMNEVFLPQLKSMGADVNLTLKRHGFAPAGGGMIECQIKPVKKWKPVHLTERGEELSRQVTCHLAHVSDQVAERELSAVCKSLDWDDDCTKTVDATDSSGPGNCLSVSTKFAKVTEMVTSHGSYGKSSERVARTAVKSFRNYLNSGAVVGHHLADQLLLPMALGGGGSMITTAPTNHMLTNIKVIQAFLDVAISIEQEGDHLHHITVSG